MPRSPLVSAATRELAQYFNATTDAAFIDRSWKINTQASNADVRGSITGSVSGQLAGYKKIYKAAAEYEAGTPIADHIANFLNGALSVGEFQSVVHWPLKDSYEQQLQIYEMKMDQVVGDSITPFNIMVPVAGRFPVNPSKGVVTLYAANVFNPYMGPMTKDIGSLEIFMNAIPTLEFSKCVPYLSVDVISLNRVADAVAPPLTLLGFLNPPNLSNADNTMIQAQNANVRSEVKDLGPGLRSGMELFTAPQTLVNLGQTGKEFVPVIDRLRPLASLGNLTLSTKVQGGTLSFTTGRLELTIHDRSRLREVAAFVRPDLYGTTFLDITYGWSHPEGGVQSRNSYGKFLDALKSTTRFRIAGSTYSFEEGGQVKVTLNIQTVGSTDLLYVGPAEQTHAMKQLQDVIRKLNEILVEKRARSTTPSMAEYDFLSAFQDPASAMAASLDKDILAKLRDLIKKIPNSDALVGVLNELVGAKDLTKDAKKPGDGSAISQAQQALVDSYNKTIDKIPTFGNDKFGKIMLGDGTRFTSMFDNSLYTSVEGTTTTLTTNVGFSAGVKLAASSSNNFYIDNKTGESDFISYGSAFMNLVAKPIASMGQYDEVQVIFYPFNRYAGAVHDLPISSFPMEKARFKKSLEDIVKRTPNVSARQIIGMMYDRFTHFLPARAYLMAGFYDSAKAEDGTVESKDPKDVFVLNGKRYAASPQLTHEKRLLGVGITEARFTLPVVQVAIEGAPLVDTRGETIKDENGKPKTIIKMHVYDAAMDPHSTITDLIRSAKDNELNVITIPVANLNANLRVDAETYSHPSNLITSKAMEVIEAGKAAGILKAINIDTGQEASSSNLTGSPLDDMKNNNVYYTVEGDYKSIKDLVTTSVPTIVYGTSTSAMMTANLQSNTSPGLGNVQLLRAFTEPGEVRAESLNTGVPMLVVPAQLSISTIGCPLFSPMQRLFIDFGTGTSIDNLYNVISFDSTIGKEGFKTDVKLGFADGFASYRSINQNLALLSTTLRGGTTPAAGASPASAAPSITFAAPEIPIVDPIDVISEARKLIRQGLVAAAMPAAQLEADTKARLQAELAEKQAKIMAKVEKEKADAIAKAEAMIPEDVRIAAAKAKVEADAAIALVKEKSEPIIRAAILAKNIAQLIAYADTLPAALGAAVIAEALAAVDEARTQAAANTKKK